MKKRDPVIDSLKGFLILCVVLGHVISTYKSEKYMEIPILYGINNVIYAFHMPLFMILSAFVYRKIYFDREGVPDSKRLNAQTFNLICLYCIYNTLAVVFTKLFASAANEPPTLSQIVFFPFKPFQIHWYLYVLIVLYLIFRPVIKCKAFTLVGGGGYWQSILSVPVFLCPRGWN